MLKVMFKNVSLKNEFGFLVWIIIVFLFRTLWVGHAVVSPHILRRRDITFYKWGVWVSENSSKNKIPIARAESNILCPVYWLESLFARDPMKESAMLFLFCC